MGRHVQPMPLWQRAVLWFERSSPVKVVGLLCIPGLILGAVLALVLR